MTHCSLLWVCTNQYTGPPAMQERTCFLTLKLAQDMSVKNISANGDTHLLIALNLHFSYEEWLSSNICISTGVFFWKQKKKSQWIPSEFSNLPFWFLNFPHPLIPQFFNHFIPLTKALHWSISVDSNELKHFLALRVKGILSLASGIIQCLKA